MTDPRLVKYAGTVGKLHAVRQRARAGREAEGGVRGVALGREIHLAGHGLERHGQLPSRRSSQSGHNCPPYAGASLYRLTRDDGRRTALAPPFPGPVAHAPGRGRDDLGRPGRLFGLLFWAAQGPLAGLISAVAVAGMGATLSWFLRRRFRAWRYQERNEDLLVARGVMVQRLSVVPYGRMQFVEVTAGPVERLFQLSTVKLHTAAAASDARIPGLGAGRSGPPTRPPDRAGRVHGGGHVTDDPREPPRQNEEWCRLHPLTPIARIGRLVPAFVLLLLVSTVHSKAENGTAETDYLIAFTLISAVYGYIHWMVTRWRFEGDTLRIETGLLRKDSAPAPAGTDPGRRHRAALPGPAARRLRTPHPPGRVGGTDGKLAYLSEAQAAELRLVLLAGHVDLESATGRNTGLPMASVDTARLLASVLLSLVTIIVVGTVAALVILDQFEPKTAAAAAAFLAVYLLSAAGVIWRRLSGQYAFIAVEAPEGVRIQRGLLQTISETVPYGRIQAVRQVEPLLWRPFGWCRLEVDIAGATGRNQRGEGTSVVRKALLPVGSQQDSWHLLARLLGGPDPGGHRHRGGPGSRRP